MADLEEQKKLLLPILQRAEEIQSVEPRMAYYCRLYAIKKGLEIPKPTQEISGLIRATFAQCEKDKPIVKPNEEEDRTYCENFALAVFRRADKVDRAGRADMNTCKAYYAAAIFMQVCEQFLKAGEELELVAPDIVEKTRYALWRAAEIRKALREGRQAAPPPDSGMAVGAAAGAGSGSAGDLFAGPAYDPSVPEQADQHPPPPPPPPQQATGGPSAFDSVTSSTDEFLSLPKPPSTVPPAGSTGLLAPAAAAGPRFRPGSRVWCGSGSGCEGAEEGTVGMVLSPIGGPGGQAVYKVALRDRVVELADSQMAPAVPAGSRVLYVAAHGEHPVPASVIAVNTERWPCTYLLQFDNGHNLDTDGGHISQAAPGEPPARPLGNQQQGPYPILGGIAGDMTPPAAPPVVDVPHHQQHVQSPRAGPPRGAAPPPPAAPVLPPQPPPAAAGGHGYPTAGMGGSSTRSGSAQQPGSPHRAAGAHSQPYQAAAGRPAPAPSPAAYQMPGVVAASNYQPSPSAISEAQKYAKYAASSLAFDDVAGGVKYLTDALRLLTQPPS